MASAGPAGIRHSAAEARARLAATRARRSADELRASPAAGAVAFVCCSYDTSFEPIAEQTRARIGELADAYGDAAGLRWSLWVVDDRPAEEAFGDRVREGFASAPVDAARLHLVSPEHPAIRTGRAKGLALLAGLREALAGTPDVSALVAFNLNRKVDPVYAAPGIAAVLAGRADVAAGSRAAADGGARIGAGALGRAKSLAWIALARGALPALRGVRDPNAPIKVLSPTATRSLLAHARAQGVALHAEWLALLLGAGLRLGTFPIVWRQRRGSRVPWNLAPGSLAELARIRRRLRAEPPPRVR